MFGNEWLAACFNQLHSIPPGVDWFSDSIHEHAPERGLVLRVHDLGTRRTPRPRAVTNAEHIAPLPPVNMRLALPEAPWPEKIPSAS